MQQTDIQVRLAAFHFLERQMAIHGDVLPHRVLAKEFKYQGEHFYLIGPQGIFKPRQLELPISLTTTPPKPGKPAPYDDQVGTNGLLWYRYRGQDPEHPDNVGMRRLFETQTPAIYFYGIEKGWYLPVFPTLLVADEPANLRVALQVEESVHILTQGHAERSTAQVHPSQDTQEPSIHRRFATVEVQKRIHQAPFRRRVLKAYADRCAICRLKKPPLLDAAHILADSQGGPPEVPNGLALCKIHHAAFDQHFFGIRPGSLTIEVRPDILRESDGPMLLTALQQIQHTVLDVPRRKNQRPNDEYLEARFAAFLDAG